MRIDFWLLKAIIEDVQEPEVHFFNTEDNALDWVNEFKDMIEHFWLAEHYIIKGE